MASGKKLKIELCTTSLKPVARYYESEVISEPISGTAHDIMDRIRDKIIPYKKSPIVSIIIVNYNGKDVIGKCLDSVFATIYPYFEVIVVDNGSTDGKHPINKKRM